MYTVKFTRETIIPHKPEIIYYKEYKWKIVALFAVFMENLPPTNTIAGTTTAELMKENDYE